MVLKIYKTDSDTMRVGAEQRGDKYLIIIEKKFIRMFIKLLEYINTI